MVVIFSFPGDKSTNKLIEWLHYQNCPFKRIDLESEDFRKIRVSYDSKHIKISLLLKNGEELFLDDVSYFYTRGVGFSYSEEKNESDLPDVLYTSYLKSEFETLTNFFYSEVNKRSVGCFRNESHSKQLQLLLAIEEGLDVPEYIISKNKNDIINHFKGKDIITKAIQDNVATTHEECLIYQRVQRVNVLELEDYFFPSFFQKEVSKEYEIRSFVLEGVFYSIKYHSNTKNVDMRDNYNVSSYESYKLPNEIEMKLLKLCKKLNLKTGSIDLIKSTSGQYYFIEINPNGQYDWVSQVGGYNLDREIAIFLKKQYEKCKNINVSNLF